MVDEPTIQRVMARNPGADRKVIVGLVEDLEPVAERLGLYADLTPRPGLRAWLLRRWTALRHRLGIDLPQHEDGMPFDPDEGFYADEDEAPAEVGHFVRLR